MKKSLLSILTILACMVFAACTESKEEQCIKEIETFIESLENLNTYDELKSAFDRHSEFNMEAERLKDKWEEEYGIDWTDIENAESINNVEGIKVKFSKEQIEKLKALVERMRVAYNAAEKKMAILKIEKLADDFETYVKATENFSASPQNFTEYFTKAEEFVKELDSEYDIEFAELLTGDFIDDIKRYDVSEETMKKLQNLSSRLKIASKKIDMMSFSDEESSLLKELKGELDESDDDLESVEEQDEEMDLNW